MKKKPLNPILGELFLGNWEEEESGKTEVFAEQVSHHPPITAYRIRNDKHGVSMDGYHLQKTTFKGGPCIERVGHVMLHLDEFKEDYLITLAEMHLEGLITGQPYPELVSNSVILGSNGVRIEIDYLGKGWIPGRGKKNSFRAKLYAKDYAENPSFSIEGQWSGGSYTITDADGKVIETVDTKTKLVLPPLNVAPLEAQDDYESRKVWHLVASNIRTGHFTNANKEKMKIEEEQRSMRAKEQAAGMDWQPKYFKTGDWIEAEKLLAKAGQDMHIEDTKGIWRWKDDCLP
jgi:oxysterol-binding protein-related protein 9/10/11